MPASTDPLDEDIRDPVTVQARVAIVQDLWPGRVTLASKELQLVWGAYFEHYTRSCETVFSEQYFRKIVIKHGDILQFIHLLEGTADRGKIRKLPQDKTKGSEVVRKIFSARRYQILDYDEPMDGLINLGARILTMSVVGQTASSQKLRSTCILPWNTGSLQSAVHSYFNQPPDIPLEAKDEFIGVGLTFYNIERVAGIKIIPTDNLLDHLLLVEEDRKLCVFHHASFLKRMLATQSPLFPDGLIHETLNTLAILLPEPDRSTKRWMLHFCRAHARITVDSELAKCGHFPIRHPSRRYEQLRFWRDRLIVLEEVVEDAMPPSSQLLSSLQKSNQQLSNSLLKAMNSKSDRWINSWFAIVAIAVTLFFGLVQSIEGAMQLYKAYHPEEESS
ncbi:hypothetical protein BKA58DRAFT_402807 [Alternaria rosae]|uniref:uncharacterized protein n=1 Tax=Alternaria rosae TaxID=1187941 RepID=UPI001E8EB203|nr:uncharacterized protein BKA58DRAFT_402807 [Alternaria rosae]KAH6868437.1 hypothetical protein BKA58DRAFT_402807 [Alternaria rosae]